MMAAMKHALPPLTKDLIEAFAASAGLWCVRLAGVILRLAAPGGRRRLHRFVEISERAVESIMFLKALHRFGPPPRGRAAPRPAPTGFRHAGGARRRRRLFFRNCGVRARKADLGRRIAQLIAALADPEPHVAYFFKRLLNGLRGACLIPVAPPASALAAAAARSVQIDDTS
jgi:hypothetical protein